jgi:predicted phage terminase large subunit-like protein
MARSTAERRAIDAAYNLFGPLRLRNCPLTPTPRQEAFLLLNDPEVFFGGAAGGGKTVAELMAALQYSDVPGYHALLLRASLAELALPGNLIDLSHQWLAGSRAVWNGDLHQWRFPGRGRSGADGATLTFGYLAGENDVARYYGSSYSFLAYDELTQFDELLYRRMFRVLRQPTGLDGGQPAPDGTRLADVPLRVRAASNPGGPGHAWVRARFIDPTSRAEGAIFLPSRLADNPHLNQTGYLESLAHQPNAEWERLVNGDWEVPDDGELFKREWVPIIEPHEVPADTVAVRYWDLASSEPSAANPDPDWTVGLRLDHDRGSGVFYVKDIVRVRKAPGAVQQLVAATAEEDGRDVAIVIEEEPGSSGKTVTAGYKAHVLPGYTVKSHRPTGPKHVRAHNVAAAAENGLLRLVRGPHTAAFLDELTSFPHGRHDDCVDALAGAHTYLTSRRERKGTIYSPAKYRIPERRHRHDQPRITGHDPLEAIAAQIGAQIWTTPPQPPTPPPDTDADQPEEPTPEPKPRGIDDRLSH